MRYAEETTHRLLWFNFAHLFSMSLLPLSTAWMAVSKLAPQPVAFYAGVFFPVNATYIGLIWELVGSRHTARRTLRPLARDLGPVRAGGHRGAEISAGRTWNLCLLPDRLFEAGALDYPPPTKNVPRNRP